MKKKISNFFKFITIIINISLLTSTLIGEKRSFKSLAQEFKSEIKSIQEAPWSFNKIDYGSYDFSDAGLGKISLTNFALYFIYFDRERMDFSVDNDNNYILSDANSGTFENIYTFVYKVNDSQNKGTFKIRSTSINFSKKYKTEDYIIKQTVTLKLNWEIVSIELPDEKLRDLVTAGLNDFLQKKMISIAKSSLDNDIKIFYDKLNKINSQINNKISFTAYSPQISLTLDFSYDKLPQLISSQTNTTLFSISGIVNGITHDDTVPKFIFSSDDATEMTISRIIFNDVLSLMTKNGLFDYSINTNNIYPESSFALNIDFLSNIIPEITNSYSRLRKISVYNVVKTLDFDSSVQDKFIFRASVETHLLEKKDDNIIFKFAHNMTMELKPSISALNLNFYIDSVKLDNVKILSEKYSVVNVQNLKNYVLNYYNLFFKKTSRFYVLKDPINFSDLTNNISKTAFTQYGFNLLLDPKFKITLNEEVRKQALKFLGNYQ